MESTKVFAPVELYFIDDKKRTMSRFAIVDNLPALLDVLQLVLDSCVSGLKNVAGLDTLSGRMFRADSLAARYGLRKRTFSERMDDVKTYHIDD